MREQLKNAVLARLMDKMDAEQLHAVAMAMDEATAGYRIEKECTDLITYNGDLERAARDYIAVKKTEGNADGTLKNYMLLLKNFSDTIRKNLGEITITDVRLWCYDYQQRRKVSDRTLNRLEGQLKSFFHWMYNEGYIQRDILNNLKRVKYDHKQKQALTSMDLERILNAAKGKKRDYAMLLLMYATGCRVSEIVGIRMSDIRMETGEITVMGKGRKQRTVYFEGRAVIALNEWIAKRKKGRGEYLFYGRHGNGKLGTHAVECMVKKYARIAGCPEGTTPHTMRHTTATIALQRGCPVQDVQRMLGHSNISTTMIYAQVSDDSVRESHKRCVV